MKKILIIILLLLSTAISFSKTLEGTGYGTSEQEAKKEALGDLSAQIQVTIKSNFSSNKSLSNGISKKDLTSSVSTTSETKLLGVEFDIDKKWFRSQYTATATIDDTKISIYEKKANELRSLVNVNFTNANDESNLLLKKNFLESALNNYNEFLSYRNIAIILGSKSNFNLEHTKTSILNAIQSVEKSIDNDSLYHGVNIIYVKSSGDFLDNSKEFFDNYFDRMLAEISKKNNDKVAISNENSSSVNTLVKVVLISNHTSKKPPVYYNKKMITPEIFETSLSITVELYNKKKVENILTITSTGIGEDAHSQGDSYEKAVKNGFEQLHQKLEDALIKK
ncbi:MAG: LPP20 family lipoprotein [Psychrilyobacter sp.]|nr:LPP20 family lipoprotein [Psychrilyobacter sp.]